METVKLAPVDVRIIQSLHKDARSSVARIASQWGMAESTVRHHLNRLVQRGIVEFAMMMNPLQFGYQIWAVIDVQAEIPKIRSVAHRLALAPEVYFVGITTGSHDVFVAAVFRSNQDLLDFITKRLSRIPGIVRTSTSSILEIVKRTSAFGLPQEAAGNGRSPRQGGRPKMKKRAPPSNGHSRDRT